MPMEQTDMGLNLFRLKELKFKLWQSANASGEVF